MGSKPGSGGSGGAGACVCGGEDQLLGGPALCCRAKWLKTFIVVAMENFQSHGSRKLWNNLFQETWYRMESCDTSNAMYRNWNLESKAMGYWLVNYLENLPLLAWLNCFFHSKEHNAESYFSPDISVGTHLSVWDRLGYPPTFRCPQRQDHPATLSPGFRFYQLLVKQTLACIFSSESSIFLKFSHFEIISDGQKTCKNSPVTIIIICYRHILFFSEPFERTL